MRERDSRHSDLRLHYLEHVQAGLSGSILAALRQAGKDPDRLLPEDLAPIDEFHTLGRVATQELCRMAGINDSMTVLDVGCGVGGPARSLAASGCRVTGVDFFADYCIAADMLTRRVGLAHLVQFCGADALALPFSDAAFDLVWSQHATMNIEDKAAMFSEMKRVLKPGGTLAIFDVLADSAGPPGPIHLPAPWARTAATSFLLTAEDLRTLLAKSGFTVTGWSDSTDAAQQVFEKMDSRIRQRGLPSLGTHILLGPDFEAMVSNQLRNFQEKRITITAVVAKRDLS